MKFAHLGLFLLMLTNGPFGFSQDSQEVKSNKFELLKKDVYFHPGGGLRVRYENLRDATGGGFPLDEDESHATHRAHFDLRLYKGEYVETFFRLINFAEWGSSSADSLGGQKDGFTRSNGLLVNQAWGLWKIDDTLGLKFGRAPLHLGLGYTYGGNDWFNVPYSFDYFDFAWDWQSVELSFIAAKVQEFSKKAGETLSSDPEENHIIINLDVKNLADSIKIFTFNLVQVNRDLGSNDNGLTVLNGLNMQRLSIETDLKGQQLFGSLFLSYVTGEEKVAPSNVVNAIEKLDIAQLAFDIKLGYRFPQFSNLGFWAGYHFDSGDDNPNDSASKTYDSFYYEVYGQSGVMDLIRWGNLSMLRLGLDLDIFYGFTVGAEWLAMERTEKTDGINFGEAGRFYSTQVNSGDLVFGEDLKIGNEYDMWIDYKFQSGVKIRTTFAMFFPGESFSNALTTSGRSPDSNFFQFLSQVGYSF